MVAFEGKVFLASCYGPGLALWVVRSMTAADGAMLLIGPMTPIASILLGLAVTGIGVYRIRMSMPGLSDSALTTFVLVMTAAAIAFLGPGAFSFDSRLFGLREIIIPVRVRSPKS
jgi:uncharacterized membrane protein YphA (DoxX/SURF4 family)